MLMILLKAASKVSVMLLAIPQARNRMVIKINGRRGVLSINERLGVQASVQVDVSPINKNMLAGNVRSLL